MKHWLILVFASVILFGCEKEELPVDPATSQALTAGMGEDYLNMLYFNVNTGLFVKQLPHTGYDLQFEGAADGKYIFLNSSNFMFVRNMGTAAFEQVTDTVGTSPWRYDFPTGLAQRCAMGNWFNADGSSKNEVYVINRGYDETGKELGLAKIQVVGATNKTYTIRVGTLDNALDTILAISKNEDLNRVQFSISNLAIEDIEPNRTDWHLHFSQYTDYDITDDGDTIPYLVRGALINPVTCAVSRLDNVDFDKIGLADVQGLPFSSDQNAIGYDWKAFSLDTGIYEVLPDVVYIIKEQSGNYYKLRFVDYYNDAGEKGFAKFEIIGL